MENELERLLNEVWDQAALLESIDRYSAQVKSAQQDDDYDTQIEALRTWVRNRPNQVREILPPRTPCGHGKITPLHKRTSEMKANYSRFLELIIHGNVAQTA